MPACPVPGCHAAAGPDHAMCGRHWALVPKRMQTAIHKAWRNVLTASRGDLARAMREHTAAKQEAVSHLTAGGTR